MICGMRTLCARFHREHYDKTSCCVHEVMSKCACGIFIKKTRFAQLSCKIDFVTSSPPECVRLTNSLMMHGRNNGKKIMAVRIVKHAMEIIHLLTDANPIQIIVDAIQNR